MGLRGKEIGNRKQVEHDRKLEKKSLQNHQPLKIPLTHLNKKIDMGTSKKMFSLRFRLHCAAASRANMASTRSDLERSCWATARSRDTQWPNAGRN